MPPKRAGFQEHQNIVKSKKMKFSATMPEFQDSENATSEEQNQQNFDRESSGQNEESDEMQVSGSEQSSKINNTNEQQQAKSQQDSQSSSKQNSESQKQQDQSQSQQKESQNNILPQRQQLKLPLPTHSVHQSQAHQSQISNVSYVSYHHLQDQNIPQQQVETDDIDSSDSRNIVVQQVRGQSIEQEGKGQDEHREDQELKSQDYSHLKPQDNQLVRSQHSQNLKMDQNQQPDHRIQVEQEQEQQQIPTRQENNKVTSDRKQKKKKKSKSKKDKGSKTKLQNLQQQDIIEQRLQNIQLEAQPSGKPSETLQQDVSNHTEEDNPVEEDTQQTNPFYEYIHPFLMLVGSSVIESYMGKKTTYNVNEASQWANQLSSKVLLKAQFDGIDQPDNLSEKKGKENHHKFIQQSLQKSKFYRNLQVELNSLAEGQSFAPIPLSKIYFMIKQFKIIASCFILQKKAKIKEDITFNISTSSYWNKQKDGQINFSYEGKNCFVMLTLYGVENTRTDKDNHNENDRNSNRRR